MTEEYYQIGPSIDNVDFYVGGTFISLIVSTEVTLTANGIKIAYASSQIDINLNSTQSANKIAQAQSSIDINVTKTPTALEILNVLLHAHIDTDVTINTSKIAYASSLINIDSQLTCVSQKITFSSSHIHNNLNLVPLVLAIRLVNNSPGYSIDTNVSALGSEILQASAGFSILSKMLVNPPIRFSPNFIDTASIRTLLMIDDKPITNHNRNLDISRQPVYIETINWNNTSRRRYKRQSNSDRAVFSLSWSFLPNFREHTVDQRMARDYLASIADDPDIHTLKIINQDQNGLTPYTETTYNVFVRSYSESLRRRDIQNGVYYFDCSLTLEEA